MSRVLPILFNTDMVRAILDGRKTVTRRLIKAPVLSKVEPPKKVILKNGVANFEWNTPKTAGGFEIKMPYQPGDIMYVRETWCLRYDGEKYFYKADKNTQREEKRLIDYDHVSWKPSIHMPKEAARIWLKVKDVRVERLQEITEEQAKAEGAKQCYEQIDQLENRPVTYLAEDCKGYYVLGFKNIWNSTIKKNEIVHFGWDASPWVWVIEFERCEKPDM